MLPNDEMCPDYPIPPTKTKKKRTSTQETDPIEITKKVVSRAIKKGTLNYEALRLHVTTLCGFSLDDYLIDADIYLAELG